MCVCIGAQGKETHCVRLSWSQSAGGASASAPSGLLSRRWACWRSVARWPGERSSSQVLIQPPGSVFVQARARARERFRAGEAQKCRFTASVKRFENPGPGAAAHVSPALDPVAGRQSKVLNRASGIFKPQLLPGALPFLPSTQAGSGGSSSGPNSSRAPARRGSGPLFYCIPRNPPVKLRPARALLQLLRRGDTTEIGYGRKRWLCV